MMIFCSIPRSRQKDLTSSRLLGFTKFYLRFTLRKDAVGCNTASRVAVENYKTFCMNDWME